MIRRALAAGALALLSGPAAALCALPDAEAATAASGQWIAAVIASRLAVDGAAQDSAPVPPAPALLTIGADGRGALSLDGSTLPVARLPGGTFHLADAADRKPAFDALIAALGIDPAALPCPLADLPQYRSETEAAQGAARAAAQTDLVQIAPDRILAVQFTRITRDAGPEITLLTALVLGRP